MGEPFIVFGGSGSGVDGFQGVVTDRELSFAVETVEGRPSLGVTSIDFTEGYGEVFRAGDN